MPDGRRLSGGHGPVSWRMRLGSSDSMDWLFCIQIWSDLHFGVPFSFSKQQEWKYWDARLPSKNAPPNLSSLKNLFRLGGVVQLGTPWGIRTPGLLVRSLTECSRQAISTPFDAVCSGCQPPFVLSIPLLPQRNFLFWVRLWVGRRFQFTGWYPKIHSHRLRSTAK